MRIRKHAKKISITSSFRPETSINPYPPSSSSYYHEPDSNLQLHICELNRSPWDVICFSSESELYYPPPLYHYQEVIRVATNTVVEDEEELDKAIDSIDSLKEEEENEEEDEVKREKKGRNFICCSRTDGKKWKCSREAKEGDSLCQHHRSLLRSYNNSINTNTINSRRKAANIKVMSLPKLRKKVKSSVSGTDYYYYSGFGPSWGKKRKGNNTSTTTTTTTTTTQIKKQDDDDIEEEDEVIEAVDRIQIQCKIRNVPPPSQVHVGKMDDFDEDDDGIGLKRRGRKPIKAISLKSLL